MSGDLRRSLLTAAVIASLGGLGAGCAAAATPRVDGADTLKHVLVRYYRLGERRWVAVGEDADRGCLRCALRNERRIASVSARAQQAIRAIHHLGLRARKSRFLAIRGFGAWRDASTLFARSTTALRMGQKQRAVTLALQSEDAARVGGADIRRAIRVLPGGASALAGDRRRERKFPS